MHSNIVAGSVISGSNAIFGGSSLVVSTKSAVTSFQPMRNILTTPKLNVLPSEIAGASLAKTHQ